VTSQLASASSVSALTRRYDRNRSFFEGARFPATQRLCSLEVERELELSRLRDWQIGWPLALKKAGGVDAGLAIGIAAGRGTSIRWPDKAAAQVEGSQSGLNSQRTIQ